MSTNNTKRSLAIGPRVLATTLMGLALVLMVVAGVYSRARGANTKVAETASESYEPVNLTSQAEGSSAADQKGRLPQPTAAKTKEESAEKQDKKEVDKGGLLEAPHPVYPEEAKKQKIEGKVTVDIVIKSSLGRG